VLVIVPKTLLYQWQDELRTLLDLPSAVWTGRSWVDENGYESAADIPAGIKKCPRKVGIVSQGLITAKSDSAEHLLSLRYSCVILDEAHRARRRNLSKDPDKHKAQPNNMLAFLNEISRKTTSLLLATATPVQINPIEAFDLLSALSQHQNADKVIGDGYSVWRNRPGQTLKYIQNTEDYPTADAEIWDIIRNPFPSRDESRSFATFRDRLDMPDEAAVIKQAVYYELSRPQKDKVRTMFTDEDFIQNHNPYIRYIIRRTRKFLEDTINKDTGEPYLRKIEAVLLGEDNENALELTSYMAQAYSIAEEFCDMLSKRVRGGGFMSTLLLKRIGSTMYAGENTAKKMLKWTGEGKTSLYSLLEEMEEDDDEDSDERSDIKDLTDEEVACLTNLVKVLNANNDTDPKYTRLKSLLEIGAEGEGAWFNKGCILFSQYYDSAVYVALRLSKDFPDKPIGLYAGGDKSGVYLNGRFKRESKDELKRRVKARELSILVGTDAASEGLNLQTLGTLINIDLPWNPTRLEQRKGRIQRIGQRADKIYIYNMRYKDSVEDKVHDKLSGRVQEIFQLFGQIPDVLEDVWVAIAQKDEQRAELAINNLPKTNPFVWKYEEAIPDCGDWEKCPIVLDKFDELNELLNGW
jgi:superfamily II DNA or RNA helicase